MAQHTFSRSRTDWSRVGKNTLLALLAFILGIVGFLLYAFQINSFSITVQLLGDEEVFLEYGDNYVESGAQLLLQGTHLFQDGIVLEHTDVLRTGELNDKAVGKYVLTYTGSCFGLTAHCDRVVTVVDSVSPVITLSEDTSKRWHIGYTAMDNYDGDITDRVKVEESLGRMSFAVLDSSGNPSYIERAVPFYDNEAPQIDLTGGIDYVHTAGKVYEEPGFSALDNADGIMTDQVLVDGEVTWYIPGTYPITYTAMDSAENEAKVIRNVEVIPIERPQIQMPENRSVYLTFDDGPGPYTEELLDILDRYGVKATFFVKDSEYAYLMKEIVDRGHSVGIHTVTHDYASVYSSPEAYFEDLQTMQDKIEEQTGMVTTLVRFPGGSSNTVSRNSYPGIMTLLSDAVQDAGYQYFDWNVDSNDAGGARSAGTVADNVIQGISQEPVSVVLQHDIHRYSVDAVEQIIQWGLEHGYTFLPLSATSPGFHHPLQN